MRYSAEHSERTKERILTAAARKFRQSGFAGAGLDNLTKAAGVTSGAFYAHFSSKSEAFRAVVIAGIERLRKGAEEFRRRDGDRWLESFSGYYLSADHRRDVGGGCALPSLSSDVSREGKPTRKEYQFELIRVAEIVASGLPNKSTRKDAWPLIAQLAGGVLLARAVADEDLAAEIAEAVAESVINSVRLGKIGTGSSGVKM